MGLRRMAGRALWGCLALVLLLAPVVGLMHGVVHGVAHAASGDRFAAQQYLAVEAPAHDHAYEDAHEHEHGHDHQLVHADAQGWLADLFSVHADDSDCRIFDQLCHSEVAAALPMLALPLVLSSFVFHFLEGEVLARRAALFEARGPPLSR